MKHLWNSGCSAWRCRSSGMRKWHFVLILPQNTGLWLFPFTSFLHFVGSHVHCITNLGQTRPVLSERALIDHLGAETWPVQGQQSLCESEMGKEPPRLQWANIKHYSCVDLVVNTVRLDSFPGEKPTCFHGFPWSGLLVFSKAWRL